MKAHLKALSGKVTIEVQSETAKGLFQELAAAMEIFDGAQCCEMCQSTNLRFNVRIVDSFTFYGLKCECGAELSYGIRKDGSGLFPKTWSKYEHVEG